MGYGFYLQMKGLDMGLDNKSISDKCDLLIGIGTVLATVAASLIMTKIILSILLNTSYTTLFLFLIGSIMVMMVGIYGNVVWN
jgi:hypothetical protein